jgi:hypothetical protein
LKLAKWGLIIALAGAALALAACGGDDDSVSNEGNEDLFTSEGFNKAYLAVADKAGDNAEALQVQITEGGADFKLRSGEAATGFIYTGGELHDEDVQVIGPGSLEGQSFPLSEVDPAAIDKIVDGVQSESGISDIKVTVMTLEKSSVDGELKWTINAEGGGRTGLVYNANPDGSNVTSPLGAVAGGGTGATGGSTTPTEPPSTGYGANTETKSPQDVVECVQQAGGDINKIQACTQ